MQPNKGPSKAGLGGVAVILLLSGLGFLWYARSSFEEHSKKSDDSFCKEWLPYYEASCKANPAACQQGPRKLAKCD